MTDDPVVIVGGGFSGTLLAINLLRHAGPRTVLVERRSDQLGRGVAYSAANEEHLLNVRAANMSALPDEPDHFVQWLEAHGLGNRTTFVPRRIYGAYLRDMLKEAQREHGDRLTLVEGEAVATRSAGRGHVVSLSDGRQVKAGTIVLALGNLPPHTPPGINPGSLPPGCYAGDPWAGDIVDGLTSEDTVVLVGSGLTAIDAALLLDAAGFTGQVLAISRRGLVPRPHVSMPPVLGLRERPGTKLSALVKTVRARAAEAGWRTAVDELRPVTQMLWGAASDAERLRFLRHLRPFWDVHRHRLAPSVAERIDALCASGRLRFAAGKIVSTSADGDAVDFRWRPRGGSEVMHTRARRIVNCTGPQGDLLRSPEALIRHLLAEGAIRPDALRIGLEVDAQSRVIGADGATSDQLYCIGPMTRGGLWEVVAVPDIRQQNWALARRLANAQWVGGEGL
ncbi:FAD/NAD(P)-binding protein [Sphingomonas sp. IC-11]|uniref:FAD/NAD(P)-binding protein n=1 Tax=Sphingomonas sp. IC-11 TaxID=2898528 RepID=UPI001E32F8F5|nr:FAD/NAD(P)-binding protein [Sphingomonas sp. IC-11]MCD2317031.1 FAD/NAD(P)-binding protein [Sphingomonas sp. IC-11]